jgi:hypothetical protein
MTGPLVVIGFVGGFVRHNDKIHKEVQLAARLQKDFPSRMSVKVFANHKGSQAHTAILRLLDSNRDGKLSGGEKAGAPRRTLRAQLGSFGSHNDGPVTAERRRARIADHSGG